jgi:hypothetical protein
VLKAKDLNNHIIAILAQCMAAFSNDNYKKGTVRIEVPMYISKGKVFQKTNKLNF